MRYSALKTNDIANGPGVRVSLFVSGCDLRCPGCFNSSTWDFDAGEEYTWDTYRRIMRELGSDNVSGLSILGGEPLHPRNIRQVAKLVTDAKALMPEKDVWIWTGRTYGDLMSDDDRFVHRILDLADVLVDGPFIQEKRDLTLRFRGSSNQRIIDLRASDAAGEAVLWSDGPVRDSHSWNVPERR